MFTEEQNAELKKKLDPKHIKGRSKGGANLSYVEGWHVIDEANTVFGFGGWSRHTVYNREVSRVEVQVSNSPGYKVGYEAKVLVCVGDTHREGTGHGSQTSKDLFDAIEGAAKEAETDAMKRALMTFGYRFGLALYDKKQENVGVEENPRIDLIYNKLISEMLEFTDADKFKQWWGVTSLPERDELKSLSLEKYKKLAADMKIQAGKFTVQSPSNL